MDCITDGGGRVREGQLFWSSPNCSQNLLGKSVLECTENTGRANVRPRNSAQPDPLLTLQNSTISPPLPSFPFPSFLLQLHLTFCDNSKKSIPETLEKSSKTVKMVKAGRLMSEAELLCFLYHDSHTPPSHPSEASWGDRRADLSEFPLAGWNLDGRFRSFDPVARHL